MSFVSAQGEPEGSSKLIVFESSSCLTCAKIKDTVMQEIEKEFKDKIEIEYRDIGNIENYKLFLSLQEKSGLLGLESNLPVFYFNGRFLKGSGNVKEALRIMIAQVFEKSAVSQAGLKIGLLERFESFKPLAVIGAGLIDGINPCAFTVIIFFLSFLVLQGYRKRHLIIISLGFIFAVFVTYALIGLGLFGFIYSIRGFWFFSRIFNGLVGIFSIALGMLSLYDFFKFRKSQDTQGLILQLPRAVKERIHAIIGLYYRKPGSHKGDLDVPCEESSKVLKPQVLRLFLSALITGFLVSILEAICTGQVYLPTITFILKTANLKLRALTYLLLYNLMFIVPLLVIFLLGLLGVTSGGFSKFFKKHLGLIKVLMAGLFFLLGIFLLGRI
ncbi:MAG: hypothetical protein QMD94_05525 [Candidatus Omnitrophota bacterium]|nr:hypothetical protein [Candidatus Omnitrophota bacterium]